VHDAIRLWPELFRGLVTGDPDDNDGERVLDLSCGAGEVTDALVKAGVPVERVDACDPYTSTAYHRRVGKTCHDWSFEDIARGDLGRTTMEDGDLFLRHALVSRRIFYLRSS
jgi:2-polyprenyl-3-methyl-5-hydroxy-6-metoxy-1,4-benzoquinol methylase